MIIDQFNIWLEVLEDMIKSKRKSNLIIRDYNGERFILSIKSSPTFTIESTDNQRLCLRNQKYIHPVLRRMVSMIKSLKPFKICNNV